MWQGNMVNSYYLDFLSARCVNNYTESENKPLSCVLNDCQPALVIINEDGK